MSNNLPIISREPLTKENYFNRVFEEFNEATNYFCKWIDKWKEINDAKYLLRAGGKSRGTVLKFHDLPASMQDGILIEFFEFVCGGKTTTFFHLMECFMAHGIANAFETYCIYQERGMIILKYY